MIKQYGQNDICFCDFLPHFFIFRFFHGAGRCVDRDAGIGRSPDSQHSFRPEAAPLV